MNRTVRFGSAVNSVPNCSVRFGSVRPIFSDFYLIVRFGLPNSSAKSEPNSSVSSVRPNFKIGKVRFGSVRHKNSWFGSPLILSIFPNATCITVLGALRLLSTTEYANAYFCSTGQTHVREGLRENCLKSV